MHWKSARSMPPAARYHRSIVPVKRTASAKDGECDGFSDRQHRPDTKRRGRRLPHRDAVPNFDDGARAQLMLILQYLDDLSFCEVLGRLKSNGRSARILNHLPIDGLAIDREHVDCERAGWQAHCGCDASCRPNSTEADCAAQENRSPIHVVILHARWTDTTLILLLMSSGGEWPQRVMSAGLHRRHTPNDVHYASDTDRIAAPPRSAAKGQY